MAEPKSVLERLVGRTSMPSPTACWLWQGPLCQGYGRISIGSKTVYAHRVMYEHLVAPIPAGMTIDHLCRNRACCNPAHLEPVTPQENTRRGAAVTTHCPSGHPYSGENLRIKTWPDGRFKCRICVTCRRADSRRKRLREKNAFRIAERIERGTVTA